MSLYRQYNPDDYEPDHPGPYTCPDCNSDNPDCETCCGTGEICEEDDENVDDR